MGPTLISAVRHGESEANLAYQEAGTTPLVYERGDDEVTLTELGRLQAAALGRLLAALPAGEAPEQVWCSPYLRALDTWRHAQKAAGQAARRASQETAQEGAQEAAQVAGDEGAQGAWDGDRVPVVVDARLRDQEAGEFARYNLAAIERLYPEELARRDAEGAYAFRPPGGESLGDVVARLRDFLADLRERADGQRVLIVAHDSVVLGLRHVLARSPDAELAAVLGYAPVLNASVSIWRTNGGRPELLQFNDVAHLVRGRNA
ncbi:histidine phosphatase family protein [Nonomuraea rosea]|uniref:phosphoglycerate mutase (2,3-diphosphoglycerate-dependent) n=1 Tax=Nonomuraea rosea TaxID=638574 RepID=A0ABP6VQT2_9ACTN